MNKNNHKYLIPLHSIWTHNHTHWMIAPLMNLCPPTLHCYPRIIFKFASEMHEIISSQAQRDYCKKCHRTRCCVCKALKPSRIRCREIGKRYRERKELAGWTGRHICTAKTMTINALHTFCQTTTRESNKFFQTTLIFHNAFSDLNRIISWELAL